MPRDLIHKRTRRQFQEHLVSSILREIELEFDSAGVEYVQLPDEKLPQGQRRGLVECYYASIDWSSWPDVSKILEVYGNIISSAEQGDTEAAKQLIQLIEKDGYEYSAGTIRPKAGMHHLTALSEMTGKLDAPELAMQISRLNEAVNEDPRLAIGQAKELVETVCKTILRERGKPVQGNPKVTALVKQTASELRLLPEDVPDERKGVETIRRVLSNLAQIAQGLAELRNLFGTGHGADGAMPALGTGHARLAVGAATTLCVFLLHYHEQRP